MPGRNLLFLTLAAALATAVSWTLVGGMCETDFSGYPDCRDDTIKAQQVALGLGLGARVTIETPLMWIDKSETWALARKLGGDALVDIVVEAATPAIWASAARATTGVTAAASARPASCARRVGPSGTRGRQAG